MKFRKRPLLVVEYDDVTSASTWVSEDSVLRERFPMRCRLVGWRMGADRKNLFLSSNQAEDKYVADRHCIPKGCIRNIRRLE